MPLQNRVTPFGDIVALPGRGTLTGNRGILHDDQRRIVRQWQNRRWIACRLEYKGIRRTIMAPHRWTQLFFLDEAVALSAGHRPCAECRRDDYRRFRSLWERCYGAPADADAIDTELHSHRLVQRTKRTYREVLARLPDGTYVAIDGVPYLVWESSALEWTDRGYARRRKLSSAIDVDVLTPAPIVGILCAGYRPEVHPSAS